MLTMGMQMASPKGKVLCTREDCPECRSLPSTCMVPVRTRKQFCNSVPQVPVWMHVGGGVSAATPALQPAQRMALHRYNKVDSSANTQ